MNLLLIETSPNGEASASREVSRYLVQQLEHEISQVTKRDLSVDPLPHITGDVVEAAFTASEKRSDRHRELLQQSDAVVDEVIAADVVIISTPMWNFSLPSVLKAWLDHLSRAGRTFSYSSSGPVGLLDAKKKVYFIISSGSRFSSGPFAAWDLATPFLKAVFGFMGVPSVEVIRVEGTNHQIGRDSAVQAAKDQIDQLFSKERITA